MKLILFTGLSASGKSAIATGVAAGLEIPLVNFHQIVHGIAMQKSFSGTKDWVSHEGLPHVLEESRKALILAIEKVENERGVIIDEVLDPETLRSLKERFGQDEFLTIYIRTNRSLRRRWWLRKHEEDDSRMTISEMRQIDFLKEQAGIREIIRGANIRIENFTSLKEITARLVESLKQEVFGERSVTKEREI